jgi:cytoskeleton protein RodZ
MADKAGDPTAAAEPASAAPERPAAQTVGQTLLKARTALGLSLEQCATDLRIEQPQLAALENDQFERIGVPVFVKGYLRQYGTRLGVDVRDLLALYYRQGNLQEIEIKPSRTIKLRDDRQLTGWVVAILAIVALAVLFGIWWYGDFQISTLVTPAVVPPAAQPRADTPRGGAPEAVAAPAEAAPAAQPVPLAQPQGAAPNPAAAEPQAAVPVPTDAPAAAPARAPEIAAAAARGPADDRMALAAPTAAREPTPDAAEKPALDSYATDVELAFDSESSAEVVDARGERLFAGNGAAGRHVELHGEPPFSVALGNADAVRLQFNGGPFPIPAEGRDGKRARFTLDVTED